MKRRKLIFIVDDDADIREAIAAVLESAEYDVLLASSGDEVLSVLERAGRVPALVLLDMMMPGATGADVLDTLERHGWLASMPVVAMSASPRDTSSVKAHHFVKKPIALEDLIDVVERYAAPERA